MFWPDDTQDYSLLHLPLCVETMILKTSQWWLHGLFLVVAAQLQLAFTAQVAVSCIHGLYYWSLDAWPCIYWYWSSSALFFSNSFSFVRFSWGFLQSVNLLSTQDRLADFTVHCLSQVMAEHSQPWHGCSAGRTGGRASAGAGAPGPLQSPLVHGSYPGLCVPSTLWWPQGPTNPLACFLTWVPSGNSWSYSMFLSALLVFYLLSICCVYHLSCSSFGGADFHFF